MSSTSPLPRIRAAGAHRLLATRRSADRAFYRALSLATGAVLLGTFVLVACAAPPAPGPAPLAPPAATAAALAPRPAAVAVPAVGATSSLIETGLQADGTLEVPPVQTPEQASWWAGSPVPGEAGPAIVLGHVNGNRRPGVFARLAELEPGAEVLIDRADGGRVRFVVYDVDTVPKSEFPTERVYADTAGPELRLITCGGEFDPDTGSYRAQVIAYARAV